MPAYPSQVVERLLRYVQIDTQSDPASSTYPSTAKQLELLRMLRDELLELGLEDATMDEYGYVTATIPGNTTREGVPVLGLFAHVDTSPEMSGAGVRPIIHEGYEGGDIALPSGHVISRADNPHLEDAIGADVITSSGDTLLGADNKAGVAELVSLAEVLLAHPEIAHGDIRLAFTPDEEIGRGTLHFDVQNFGADAAYTVDSESLGQLDVQTFSADTLHVTFQGFNTHPGFARGVMVNAIKVAADFIASLPRDGLSPETTDGLDGYVHPFQLDASVDRCTVTFLLRDFESSGLDAQAARLQGFAHSALERHPGASVSFERTASYRNIKEVLDDHPDVVERAREAIRRAGLSVREGAIRGGTDGAHLSFQGLPTPNIFAGEHNVHSRLEWVSTRELHKAVETLVHLACVWEEGGRP